MKLILCTAIVILSAYIGRLLAKRMAQRLDFFREYQSAMIGLADRIVGMNLELYKALDAPRGGFLGAFFRDCARALKNAPQSGLERIWKDCFEKRGYTFLAKEDAAVVLAGGAATEALCKNPSEKQAEGYAKRLAAYIDEMEAEKRKKCKLYNTAGILAGLFIALLVI